MPSSSRARALGAAALVVLVPALAAADPYGRVTEPHEVVTTTIAPAADADDFVFDAGAGWKVSASAKRAKADDLAPVLELVDPDGAVTTSGVVAKATAASAKLSATLASGGRWGIRLRGSSGTGACTLKWKLVPAKVAPVKGMQVAANVVRPFAFPARGGALVSWKLKFKGDGGCQVDSVKDPDGGDAGFDPGDEDVVRRTLTSEAVKDFPLPAGRRGGDWALGVRTTFEPALVSLSIQVKLAKVASSSLALTADEPVLISLSSIAGGCGAPVDILGGFLSQNPRGILFGAASAISVQVADAEHASCRVPAGTGTVDVVFVAADGQVAVLPGAYSFLPGPVIDSFDPGIGPGQGGTDLTLRGRGFQEGIANLYYVIVGGVNANQVRVLDSETITCRTPANVAGPKAVLLRNSCGEEVAAPGAFTYGAGLFITTVRPEAAPVFGGVEVIVSGANFLASDQVSLDGSPVATTPVIYQGVVIGHRIAPADLPAHAPGKVDVKVQGTGPGGASATKVGGLAYFTFSDATAASIPAAGATDDWGGVSQALADGDANGSMERILLLHTDKLSSARPGLRVLKADGSGVFSDATASAVPSPTPTEGWGGNAVLSGRLNTDDYSDVYLSRPGTGVAWDKPPADGTPDWNEARMLSTQKHVNPWGHLLFSDSSGTLSPQTVAGPLGLLSISGIVVCNATWACGGVQRGSNLCKLYDFDFRSVAAAMGDMDGDFDQDVVLVNDGSLADFTGTAAGVWVSCYGYNYVNYQYYTAVPFGHATRICSTGSNGGLTDRTATFMETAATVDEDFRAVAASVADMTADFLNDVLIVHNQGITLGGQPASAARLLYQRNSGSSVTFKQNRQFFPVPVAGGDDWRGDAIAGADFNGDFYRDVVVSINGPPVGSATLSTRILVQDSNTARLVDRTSAVLGGLFPSGDDGRARVVIARDIDRDGDQDLILSTPDAVGAGNRRTRLLLNNGTDPATGLPRFLDGSSLLPAESSDPGNAVAVSVGDVDGDGDLDLVLTDTHQASGPYSKRTRIWKQLR